MYTPSPKAKRIEVRFTDPLTRGDVFGQDVIDTWLGYKRSRECGALQLRPHPYDFMLYYDAGWQAADRESSSRPNVDCHRSIRRMQYRRS
jgi:glutamine synthetase